MSQMHLPSATRDRREEGFTLIELIVVITIIGILASFVVVRTAGIDDQARQKQVRADFKAIKTAAAFYKSNHRMWPETLDDLLNPPDGADPYLESEPVDPWAEDYSLYEVEGNQIILVSYGADGAEGGEGPNADIRSDDSGRN